MRPCQFLLVLCSLTAVAADVRANLASFDELVRQLMSCRSVPGLVVTVVDLSRPDETHPVVVQRQYGWADVDARQPMTPFTRVCVASLTKAFTSTLLGIMMENTETDSGETVTWDTPLSHLLPEDIAAFDDDWVTRHVTLRDALLHRTGVRRSYDELWLMNAPDRRDIVRNIKNMEASSNFRSKAVYNNVIYSLVGHVVERLGAGRSWESLLRQLVLHPLNMTQTSFYDARDNPGRFARPYLHPDGDAAAWTQPASLPRGISSVSSAVSVCSTPRDMAHWITALLRSASASTGRCDGRHCPILPPSVVRETFQPSVIASAMIQEEIRRPRTDVPFHIDGYGLGWFTGHYRGWKTVLHYGSLIGAYSLLTLLPEMNLGIFSSYNGAIQTDPYTLNSLFHVHLIDLFLGVPPSIHNASDWCRPLDARRSRGPHGDIRPGAMLYPSAAYTGTYRHSVLGQFEVWQDDTETLRGRYGAVEISLQPLNDGLEFFGEPSDRAWTMLLGAVYVKFTAATSDEQVRCPSVSVELITLTTFQRQHGHSAAVSTLRPTLTSDTNAAHLLSVCVVMITLSFHRAACRQYNRL